MFTTTGVRDYRTNERIDRTIGRMDPSIAAEDKSRSIYWELGSTILLRKFENCSII